MNAVDFATLPPEVNSGWMHAGPGSESMLAAAAAWDELATELSSAASAYRAALSTLTDDAWQGPAAASMSAAAAPYAAWMNSTAEQARQVATQARAAAAAYQEAVAATVPPPGIAANRAQLQSLLATNTIGQNTPAIAANQAQYGEMWAQDATAMYTYAANSAAAAALPSFTEPPQTTNPAGQGIQAAATSQAAATAAQASSLLQGLSSGNPLLNLLEQINNFFATNPVWAHNGLVGGMGGALFSFGALTATTGAPSYMAIAVPMQSFGPIIRWFFPHIIGGAAAAATMSEVSGSELGMTLASSSAPQPGAGVSAGLGRAALVGGLSVPQSWSTPIQLASAASPLLATMPAGVPAAGLGGFGGAPFVPALVDKPGNHQGLRHSSRTKLVPELPARRGAAGDAPSRWIPSERATPTVTSPLSAREHSELRTLRTIVADLVNQRDKAADSIKEAIRS